MKYLRFSDLMERGRFGNRMTCDRQIRYGLFDPGFLASPGMRVWTEDRVDLYDAALRAAAVDGHKDMLALSTFVQAYVRTFDATEGDTDDALKAAREAVEAVRTAPEGKQTAEHAGA